MAITWGLDMSTDPAYVGLVSVEWDRGTHARFTRYHKRERMTDALVGRMLDTAHGDWWAVDVPFGWPDGWAQFLLDHRRGPSPLPDTRAGDKSRWARVARRRTDLHVINSRTGVLAGVPGFSVTFDKLGATAAAWSDIEWRLFDHTPRMKIDRTGLADTVRIVETYPAAAWRRWGLAGNPASAGASGLETVLAEHVVPAVGDWDLNPHECDALVCALVARARAMGKTELPHGADVPLARTEGWIHLQLPEIQFRDLVSG